MRVRPAPRNQANRANPVTHVRVQALEATDRALEGYRRRTGRARGGVGPTGEGEVTRVDGGSSEDEMHGAQAAGRRREGHAGDLVHVGKKAQGGRNKK